LTKPTGAVQSNRYNTEHHIHAGDDTEEIRKSLTEQIKAQRVAREAVRSAIPSTTRSKWRPDRAEMLEAAEDMDFERARPARPVARTERAGLS